MTYIPFRELQFQLIQLIQHSAITKTILVGFHKVNDFSNLSKIHSPIEVINILNEIYTVFDSRLDLFNVYKVETINDSYLGAST